MLDNLGSWRRTHYTNQITEKISGEEVTVFGWIHEIRDLGGIAFIILRDKEDEVQVTILKKNLSEKEKNKVKLLKREAVVGVKGTVKRSKIARKGVEIILKEMKILNLAKTPLPIDTTGKIPASLDKRLNARVLDLRLPDRRAIFKIHHTMTKAIRGYLTEKGFTEVFTPKILATATEGGAELFSVKYFEREAYLAQSPQLYKEALTSAFERVFEIGQFYRAEESNTAYHLNEFISVDIEAAFAEAEDVMKILEELIVYVINTIRNENKNEIELLNKDLYTPRLPFKRITYNEAIEILQKSGIKVEWGEDLPTIANRVLGEKINEPFFIIDWPIKLKPFYIKPKINDPKLSDAFDLNWSWLELASGGTRVHDKNQLIERLKAQRLEPKKFEPFISYYDYGMPPHAGWAIGLQRLLMVITDRKNIREVTLFPREKDRLIP